MCPDISPVNHSLATARRFSLSDALGTSSLEKIKFRGQLNNPQKSLIFFSLGSLVKDFFLNKGAKMNAKFCSKLHQINGEHEFGGLYQV